MNFDDFASEKVEKDKVVRMKIVTNSYIFEEAARIYQKCNVFDIMKLKSLKIFIGRLPLAVILFASFNGIIFKMGRFPTI